MLPGLIRRVNFKKGKLVPFPEGEPDFYLISRLYPLPPPVASDESLSTPSAAGLIAPYVKPTSQSVQNDTTSTDRAYSATASFAAASMTPSASMAHIYSNEMTSWSGDIQYPWPSLARDSSTVSSAAITAIHEEFANHAFQRGACMRHDAKPTCSGKSFGLYPFNFCLMTEESWLSATSLCLQSITHTGTLVDTFMEVVKLKSTKKVMRTFQRNFTKCFLILGVLTLSRGW